MDASCSSPEPKVCKSFREAFFATGSTILRGLMGADPVQEFARCTAAGLASFPRSLDCRFLYDSEGSSLFELITEQPEYYLTRSETSILAENSHRIRSITGPATILELGSGSSVKTGHLLNAWSRDADDVCYVPVDVSESALRGASKAITDKHRNVRVIGVNCDFRQAFPLISQLSPVMVLLLGSTIGNLPPEEMFEFLCAMASAMNEGDYFLVGIDLVKSPSILEAAYNDKAGVTARFTRNIFARMNRELGCAIDTEAIEHVARYNARKEQVEIFARFNREQTLFLSPLNLTMVIGEGEMVQTEISRKFHTQKFVPYLEEFGFSAEGVFSDELNWFSLVLLRRTGLVPNRVGNRRRR